MRLSIIILMPGVRRGLAILLLALTLPCGLLFGQAGQPAASSAAQSAPSQAKAGKQPAEPGEPQAGPRKDLNEQFGVPLAEESRAAAKEAEEGNSQERMIEEMKQSPSVRFMSRLLHVNPVVGYWIGIILDFVILALLIYWGLKKSLPTMFRQRTASIRQGIDEGRKASEDAARRLADIETKLARLGDEVNAMRAAAEREAAAEAERIAVAVEQEKQHIVAAADVEIAAVTRTARRELKAYAADLAVSLAERGIHLDQATDEALVRNYTGKLGAAAGKDGK